MVMHGWEQTKASAEKKKKMNEYWMCKKEKGDGGLNNLAPGRKKISLFFRLKCVIIFLARSKFN